MFLDGYILGIVGPVTGTMSDDLGLTSLWEAWSRPLRCSASSSVSPLGRGKHDLAVTPATPPDRPRCGNSDVVSVSCIFRSVSEGGGQARDNSVQSVDRAISILQVLARHGGAGVTDIAKELSVHKSTVSRLLGTLEARGLVEQASSRGRYRLGYGVVQLAAGASKRHDLTVISRTVCDALAEDVGETVNVVVHEGRSVVTIDQVMGSASVTTVNWVGQRNPLHATSAGKVFLASMPRAELQTYLDEKMTRFTEHTIVDPARLETELAAVRERGYSWTFDEQEIGLAAVAAPIRALDGGVIAALTVSGPTFRIDEATIPGIAERLLSAAAQISERNGYPKAG